MQKTDGSHFFAANSRAYIQFDVTFNNGGGTPDSEVAVSRRGVREIARGICVIPNDLRERTLANWQRRPRAGSRLPTFLVLFLPRRSHHPPEIDFNLKSHLPGFNFTVKLEGAARAVPTKFGLRFAHSLSYPYLQGCAFSGACTPSFSFDVARDEHGHPTRRASARPLGGRQRRGAEPDNP
ncbi:hypothetical protein B0H17DRAFT_1185721 [Mycena rosella]|uniref:Uncharacterized protein n=1 Tax=Mycena rosella TaxID=1033263 RepID=A0AAD7G1G9_MYCRO|nr:hypothetical protein B0H17DRAFT_1185721 [Mycena rosella]